MLFTLLVYFLVPAILLFAPAMAHITWAHLLFMIPDIGYFTFLVILSLLIMGIIRVAIMGRGSFENKQNSIARNIK